MRLLFHYKSDEGKLKQRVPTPNLQILSLCDVALMQHVQVLKSNAPASAETQKKSTDDKPPKIEMGLTTRLRNNSLCPHMKPKLLPFPPVISKSHWRSSCLGISKTSYQTSVSGAGVPSHNLHHFTWPAAAQAKILQSPERFTEMTLKKSLAKFHGTWL